MFKYLFENKVLKELAGIMLMLNSVVLVLSLYMVYMNSQSLHDVHKEIKEIRTNLDEEIKQREELFPKLRKSANLLMEYNPRLDSETALKYACKIYECSEDPITPELLTALIVVESSANHVAVSSKGAIGLTQIMPNIWRYQEKELLDPYRNIEIGSKILKHYIDKHGIQGGLSSYNCGNRNNAQRYARYVLRLAEKTQDRCF